MWLDTTPSGPRKKGEWSFLTNHAHVLLCVAHDPGIRLRDIAAAIGLSERGTHQILSQLIETGEVAVLLAERTTRSAMDRIRTPRNWGSMLDRCIARLNAWLSAGSATS